MTPDKEITAKKYRKKPVVIEAKQYFENKISSNDPFWDWMTGDCEYSDPDGIVYDLYLEVKRGNFIFVDNGDWIIKDIKGEFYPCKPDIFEATYELVKEPWPSDLTDEEKSELNDIGQ